MAYSIGNSTGGGDRGSGSGSGSGGPTPAQFDARDAANRQRDNHTGTQTISTVEGLAGALQELTELIGNESGLRSNTNQQIQAALAQLDTEIEKLESNYVNFNLELSAQAADLDNRKADKSLLHDPITLHPESGDGLSIDGQQLRYTPPEPPEPSVMYAEAASSFEAITEPKHGVVYAIAGVGSYMLNQAGDQWIQLGSLKA